MTELICLSILSSKLVPNQGKSLLLELTERGMEPLVPWSSENWCRIEVSAHTENLSCRGQVLGLIKPRSSIMLDIITFTLGCPLVFHGGLQYLIGVSPGPFGHILVFGFSWSEVDQPKEPVIYKIQYRLLVEVQTYPLRIADNHLRSDDTEPWILGRIGCCWFLHSFDCGSILHQKRRTVNP